MAEDRGCFFLLWDSSDRRDADPDLHLGSDVPAARSAGMPVSCHGALYHIVSAAVATGTVVSGAGNAVICSKSQSAAACRLRVAIIRVK